MEQISANEAMRRLKEDIDRGYPESMATFRPWSSGIGTITQESVPTKRAGGLRLTGLPMWLFIFFMVCWVEITSKFKRSR